MTLFGESGLPVPIWRTINFVEGRADAFEYRLSCSDVDKNRVQDKVLHGE